MDIQDWQDKNITGDPVLPLNILKNPVHPCKLVFCVCGYEFAKNSY